MSRDIRISSVLMALIFVVASPASAADSEVGSQVVFDLANPEAVVGEHTAQLLWNLATDNIVADRVDSVSGWNSLYLETPGTVSGTVTIDLDSDTVSGVVSEQWSCDNDCTTSSGEPSWPTTMASGWTATIEDGRLASAQGGWDITGSVAIEYQATVTKIESPSICGDTECYVCEQRLCQMSEKVSTLADFVGWTDGETLYLAFADRLEEDVLVMDFSELRRTQFFMTRFALEVTGAAVPPTTEPSPEPESEETPGSTVAETPDLAVVPIPGVDAGAPPSEFDDKPEPDVQKDPAAGAAQPPDTDKNSPIGSFIVAIALLFGVAIAFLIAKQLLEAHRSKTPLERASGARGKAATAQANAEAANTWFREHATHVIEPGNIVHVFNPELKDTAKAKGVEFDGGGPLPLSIQIHSYDSEVAGPLVPADVVDGVTVIQDPDYPDYVVLRNGTRIFVNPGTLTPLPNDAFNPLNELTGTKHTKGRLDESSKVCAYPPGTRVQVITTAGDQTLVRLGDDTRVWVPRASVGPATARIDPPA